MGIFLAKSRKAFLVKGAVYKSVSFTMGFEVGRF